MKVQEIDRAWQPKIQQAEDQQQADQMATEATDEMIGQIEAQGLSVEEYNAITQAAEQDQQLYDRIVALLAQRSEEHTSELQSLMRISYAVFCLKKQKIRNEHTGKTAV